MAKKTTSKKVRKQTVNERQVYRKDWVIKCRNEAEDATKLWRRQREELWNLYQNIQDTSRKKDWQSKCFVPKIFTKVLRAAALIKRALFQTGKLFKFEPDMDDLNEQVEKLREQKDQLLPQSVMPGGGVAPVRDNVQGQIDILNKKIQVRRVKVSRLEKQFKRKLSKSNFTNIFGEMSHGAILLGLGDVQVLWKKKLHFENTDVLNVWISPSHIPFSGEQPEYLIERKKMSLSKLRKIATVANKATGKAIWDFVEIDKIEGGWGQTAEIKVKERRRKGQNEFIDATQKIELLYFWGSVVDEQGFFSQDNRVMVVANEMYLILDQAIPYSHGKSPHNLIYPITHPHKGTSGVSLAEPIVKLQYVINNVFNMYVDALNWAINPVFEYNPNQMKNPTDALTMFPGKTIPVNSDTPVLRPTITKPVGPEAITAIQTISKEIDEGMSVNEFVQGTAGKSKTLGEYKGKAADTQGLFDVIARDIEQNGLKPVLEMAYDLCEQFGELEGREGLFEFKVGGVSLLLAQEEQRRNIGEIIMLALQAPPLGEMTDIEDLWKKLLSVHNLSDSFKEADQAQVSPELSPTDQRVVDERGTSDATKDMEGMTDEQKIDFARKQGIILPPDEEEETKKPAKQPARQPAGAR